MRNAEKIKKAELLLQEISRLMPNKVINLDIHNVRVKDFPGDYTVTKFETFQTAKKQDGKSTITLFS